MDREGSLTGDVRMEKNDKADCRMNSSFKKIKPV